MRFANKIAVVTGAAQGIGEKTARDLASEGCLVALTDVNAEQVKKVAKLLKSAGFKAEGYKMDVTSPADIDATVAKVIEKYGHIDVLVHCAAIYPKASFLEMTESQFDTAIQVNLKGTFLCCQRVAREMVKNNYGRIICLSSIAGQHGATAGRSHYGAAKGGVIALCKSMARELGAFGITVNVVAPGVIYTEMTKESIESGAYAKLVDNFVVKRFGESGDVAAAVLYLASKEASYVTGATIDVNGGLYI